MGVWQLLVGKVLAMKPEKSIRLSEFTPLGTLIFQKLSDPKADPSRTGSGPTKWCFVCAMEMTRAVMSLMMTVEISAQRSYR